jgi:hypothetical protein
MSTDDIIDWWRGLAEASTQADLDQLAREALVYTGLLINAASEPGMRDSLGDIRSTLRQNRLLKRAKNRNIRLLAQAAIKKAMAKCSAK